MFLVVHLYWAKPQSYLFIRLIRGATSHVLVIIGANSSVRVGVWFSRDSIGLALQGVRHKSFVVFSPVLKGKIRDDPHLGVALEKELRERKEDGTCKATLTSC